VVVSPRLTASFQAARRQARSALALAHRPGSVAGERAERGSGPLDALLVIGREKTARLCIECHNACRLWTRDCETSPQHEGPSQVLESVH